MALSGFIVAIVVGLVGEHLPLVTILERSLVSAVICFGGGMALGLLLDGVINRHAQHLRIQTEQMEEDQAVSLDPSHPESDGEPHAESSEPMMAV